MPASFSIIVSALNLSEMRGISTERQTARLTFCRRLCPQLYPRQTIADIAPYHTRTGEWHGGEYSAAAFAASSEDGEELYRI